MIQYKFELSHGLFLIIAVCLAGNLYPMYINGIIYSVRDIDDAVEKSFVADAQRQLQALDLLESQYVEKQLQQCVSDQLEPVQMTLSDIGGFSGFKPVSQEQISQQADKLFKRCSKSFVLAASSVSDLSARNRILTSAGMAPFSQSELAQVAQAED